MEKKNQKGKKMNAAVAQKVAQQEKWSAFVFDAEEAGNAAAEACKPVPMVVFSPKVPFFDESPDLTKPVYDVPDGPCGFSWVNMRAVKGPEGKEARQFLLWLLGRVAPAQPGLAARASRNYMLPDRKSYYGGYDVYVTGFRQSMALKSAAARKYARFMEAAIPGLECWPMERMD